MYLRLASLIFCLFSPLFGAVQLSAQDVDEELDRLLKAVESGDTSDEELNKLLADPKLSKVAEMALELDESRRLPKWSPVVTLEGGLGVKKNVALSPVRPETSALMRTLLDLIVIRDSSDGLESFIYGSWEDFRYHDSAVDKEQTGLLMTELKKEFESGWDLSWSGQYIYQNQVLDLSTDQAVPDTLRIEGNTFLTSATARRYLTGRYWAEGKFELGRQNFISPLDDYWEYSPRLELAKWWKQNHVALSYQFTDRPYDNRREPDFNGLDIVGTQLEFNVHRVQLEWKQEWGANQAWRATTRVRREISTDNGTGYFKFKRWRLGEKLRYKHEKWTVTADANWSFYYYPNQVAALGLAAKRRRTDWNFAFRVDRVLSKYWKGYLAYDWEKSDSNQNASSYSVNLVHAGVVFER